MGENSQSITNSLILKDSIGSSLSWLELIGDLWKIGKKVIRGLSNEGMYEVLDYETTLELHDPKGHKASFKKREKVRYLQDNIIAFQDQAWGDGEILIGYKCSPGVPVDQYRSGHVTHILISSREVKNKGDITDFQIEWDIHRGFLKPDGFWETEINHRTRQVKVHVIFPKTRPPQKVCISEKNMRKSYDLGVDAKKRLPDGRWLISWEKKNPRLYERYILAWEW
ncbi:MAG: hypothetical protein JW908_05585 [Anaerolineales bacterium]|nr:hypothetical protein [Anaerolineales bacterium]